jgi:hypothetical protein
MFSRRNHLGAYSTPFQISQVPELVIPGDLGSTGELTS